MYSSTDKLYKLSKEALRGEKQELIFEKLINWIKKRFEINVIYVDYVFDKKDNRPKLHLIVENQKDYRKLMNNENEFSTGYKKEFQNEISEKFRDILSKTSAKNSESSYINNLLIKIGLKKRYIENEKYKTKNIWVCYSVFSTVYNEDICSNFRNIEIEKLIKKYKTENDQIWEIHMTSNYITLFFETEMQIYENSRNISFEKMKTEYYEMIKEADEFNLIKIENINLSFDSKENFDKNYESNWYYYYK
jgi:hypothetical protein